MNKIMARADCHSIQNRARSLAGVLILLVTIASCGGGSSPTQPPTQPAAQSPLVSLSQATLSFPSQAVGNGKASEALTISNTGTAPLVISSISLSGSNSSDFQQTSTCGASVAPNGSCVVTITFAPTVAGSESADLKVLTNASPPTSDIPLSGSGVIPMLSLLAGNPGGPGTADGTTTTASFESPYSIAVDSSGTVFVTDTAAATLRKITSSGVVSTLSSADPPYICGVGSGTTAISDIIAVDYNDNLIVSAGQCALSPSGASTLLAYNGQGLAVDRAGNAYVTDGSVIYKVTPDDATTDVVVALAGAYNVVGSADGTGPQASFRGAKFMTTDSNGNVYVADVGNSTIRKITPSGVVTTLAGTAGVVGSADGLGPAASFFSIGALATDSGGNVYVADSGNSTIREISPGGMVTTFAGTAGVIGSADGAGAAASFSHADGIATDRSGNLFVADTGNGLIREISAGGVVTTYAGSRPTVGAVDGTGAAAQFSGPTALAADAMGNVYVADSGNDTIRKISAAGVVTTLAGVAGAAGAVDGNGAAARFANPQGVALDSSGSIYVADTGNHAVRKISPGGDVTTLASGSAGLQSPVGIAVDSTGTVYVSDGAQVRTIAPTGTVSNLASSIAGRTLGALTVDPSGIVYVIDQDFCQCGNVGYTSSVIDSITPSGAVTVFAGGAPVGAPYFPGGTLPGAIPAGLSNPVGIATDSAGNVYVADTGHNYIQKIVPGGNASVIVGQLALSGFQPGPLPGLLRSPQGIAISGTTLYTTSENAIVTVSYVP
jgi:sugar lactone lactonase YvrE